MPDATTGELLGVDSPSGRVARAHEIDAAWQQLWLAEYGAHVDEAMRQAFEEDYKTWQSIKENLSSMGTLSIMSPTTGELLERWHIRAADWYGRFKELAVPMQAPKPKPNAPSGFEGLTGLAWAVAGIVASGALLIVATKLAQRAATPRSLAA